MSDARQVYRRLLKLYPARFREEYETPLERQFWDEYCELEGRRARARFWLRALADLALSIPLETVRELRQDAGYALRVHGRRPVLTALAVAALALAIGAATGVFSVVNALLLRSLPFRDPSRLVDVMRPPVSTFAGEAAFRDWRLHNGYLEDVAGYAADQFTLMLRGDAFRVKVAEVSANFFSVLGVEPEFGRAFAEGEDLPGRNNVAVISNALWLQQFGGDTRVLGSTIRLGGVPVTVVGVAPPAMDFPARTAVWTATVFELQKLPKDRAAFFASDVGRLRAGMRLAQANQMLQADGRRRGVRWNEAEGNRPRLTSLRNQLAGSVGQASLVLLGIVGFVLAIACANVAHLLLSRITERRQELVVRSALGASRSRLVQQLITESLLLTVAAAAAGMGVAQVACRVVSAAQPAAIAAQEYTLLDWRVLGFAVLLAVFTGILFGVLPAGLIARLQPAQDLVRARAHSHGLGMRRMRSVLLAFQAALTVTLLAGSVTLGRSFLRLLRVDLGFRAANVVTLTASPGTVYSDSGRVRTYYRAVLDRLRSIPGVEFAGAAQFLPLVDQGIALHGFQPDSGPEIRGSVNYATPGYFRATGTELLAGRDFEPADGSHVTALAIVNEEIARHLGGARRALGQRLRSNPGGRNYTIVGVVRGTRMFGPGYGVPPQLFVAAEQVAPDFMSVAVRVHGDPARYVALCRDAAREADPQVAVYDVRPLTERLDSVLSRPRFYTNAVIFFAGFALLLAILGIYGAASFSISRRTHEIGVRLAVGASPRRMRAVLLRQSLLPLLAGSVAGIMGAAAVGQAAAQLIEGAEPVGLVACATAAGLLAAVASAAVWRATRRILAMEPARILTAG